MDRRGFFGLMAALALAKPRPEKVVDLVFHPDAFALEWPVPGSSPLDTMLGIPIRPSFPERYSAEYSWVNRRIGTTIKVKAPPQFGSKE